MKHLIRWIVVIVSVAFVVLACCNYTPSVRAYNKAASGTSRGCGVGGGYVYQSFLASYPRIESVALLLRAGGGFPASGYTTHIKLRDCRIDGAVLAEASATVSGPLSAGKQLYVTFELPEIIEVTVGRRCIIQWASPPEGGVVLTWMVSSGDTYPDGKAYGCTGTPIDDEDFIFQVMPLD